MNLRSMFLAASLLLFGSSPSAQAQEGQINTLEGKIQPILVCAEEGYAYLDAIWGVMASGGVMQGLPSPPRSCQLFPTRSIPWSLRDEQNMRILRVGFDSDMDSLVMHEGIGFPTPWRSIALTSIWREEDPDMLGPTGDRLPAEDNANLLRIEHIIPVTEPGRMLAGCETLNMLSFLISDYLNGYDFDFEGLVCMDGEGRPIPEQYLVNLDTPVTLTTHVGDKAITAYEVEYRGKTAYVLVERDLG